MIPRGDDWRAREAMAKAASAVAADIAYAALARFWTGNSCLAELLEALSFAGREAEIVLLNGWTFLGESADV